VIIEAVRLGTVEDAAADDPDVVAVDLDLGTKSPEPRGSPRDPVGLLVAELARATDVGGAGRGGGGQAQDGDLVDRGGNVGRAEFDLVQVRRPDDDVGDRLAHTVIRAADGAFLDVGSHRSQDVDHGTPGRIDTHVVQDELGVGMDGARNEPERRRRDVARDPFRHRVHRQTSFDRHGHSAARRARALDRHAARPQHPFRVVARGDRFVDRRSAIRSQPRQQDRGLHLRAWHRRRELDRPERGTTDHGHGREGVVLAGVKLRAHRAQWFDDTSDRSAAQ
jgi:hypothetical protein